MLVGVLLFAYGLHRGSAGLSGSRFVGILCFFADSILQFAIKSCIMIVILLRGDFKMGFHTQRFAESTGLCYDKKECVFWGEYFGYPISLCWNAQRNYLIFTFCVDQPEGVDMDAAIREWQLQHAGFTNCQYQNNMLRGVFVIRGRKPNEATIDNLQLLIEFLQQKRVSPCCAECGTTTGHYQYLLNGTALSFCSGCADRVDQAYAANQEEQTNRKAKPIGVALGALIGAAVLFIVTYILYELGYIAYISGAAGVFTALFCAKKFGGKITLAGGLFTVALCLLVAFLTPCFCVAKDFSEHLQSLDMNSAEIREMGVDLKEALDTLTSEEIESYIGCTRAELQQTYDEALEMADLMDDHPDTWACFVDLAALMKTEMFSPAKGELIKNILWGVLSVIIAACCTLPGIIRSDNGKYRFRQLI